MTILKTMTEDFHLKGDVTRAHYNRLTPEEEQLARNSLGYENRKLAKGDLRETALKKEKYQRYIHDYLRCVKANDENVGRILKYLEESGLAENTLICYSSDQGFYLGEHGWYDKRFMYNESFFTPLLMRWPGHIEPGTVVEELVQNIDIAPTFLSLGKAPIPEVMQGVDLTPLLYGITPLNWRTLLYYHFYESDDTTHKVPKHEGVFDGRYKLIHFYEIGEWEFFDCDSDPYEMHNRINDPDYQEVISSLKTELTNLKRQYEVEIKN
jgi:arylsulfatase A-like enzyme